MRITTPLLYGRRAAAALLLVAQAACFTAPRAVEAPARFLQSQTPKRIWVSLFNGEQLVIDAPKVYGDSLLGFTRKGDAREEVWLPLSDLTEVKTRRVSGARTALVGGLIAVTIGLGLVLVPSGGTTGEKQCKNEGVPCEDA